MPQYVYQRDDGSCFEVFQHMSEDALEVCPTTGQSVTRVPQLPRVHGQTEIRSMAWGVDQSDPNAIEAAEAVDGCKIDRETGDAIFENEAALRRTKNVFSTNQRISKERELAEIADQGDAA